MKKKMIILENTNPKELSPVLPKKIQKDFVVTKWGGGGGGKFGFDLAHVSVAFYITPLSENSINKLKIKRSSS